MKKNHRAKRTLFPLLGSAIALLFVFFACDFEASKIGRTIGGSLAEGDTRGNEFIEGALEEDFLQISFTAEIFPFHN